MAFFGTPTAYVGIDLGTASIKLVELVARSRRIEVGTYAYADVSNELIHQRGADKKKVIDMTKAISEVMDKAGTSSEHVVMALPNSVVFSTVISLPNIPDDEMGKAVQFAAQEVVPADIDEMVIGWSKVGKELHMEVGKDESGDENDKKVEEEVQQKISSALLSDSEGPVPVFLTAAPRHIVDRYLDVVRMLGLELVALEVETIPLVRALLVTPPRTALIVDIGNRTTTYHIVDNGTPRISHSIDVGGHNITAELAGALSLTLEDAEREKEKYGVSENSPEQQYLATVSVVNQQIEKARSLLELYKQKEKTDIKKTILIGGGANLIALRDYWSRATGCDTRVGDPWRGLAYPEHIEGYLASIGPTFGIAVGLALRGLV